MTRGGTGFRAPWNTSVENVNYTKHFLDFATMTWSNPVCSVQLEPRYGGMATCYNDVVVVMGGKDRIICAAVALPLSLLVCCHAVVSLQSIVSRKSQHTNPTSRACLPEAIC